MAVPSITYAGRPIGIGAAFVIRAVGQQLVGAISIAAGGWWLQTAALAHYSSFARILLSTGFCISIYLIIVVGLFRLAEPIKVAGTAVQDQLRRNR
jgi:PST family polysaccharide transporter